MTRDEFRKLTSQGLLLLDGATGTNLQKQGLTGGVCPDLWIMENPEIICSLQRAYLEAGSRILYSPTFSCNRIKLEEYGLYDRLGEMNRTLVGLSKKTVEEFRRDHPESPECYVAGDVSMTGVQLEPVGPMGFEELVEIYKEQIKALAEGGADLIVVETMMSLQETRAAVIACREICDLPIMTTLTFEADGRTLYGTDPVTALITLQSLGVDAFGANCSTGPEKMLPIIRKLHRISKIPLICKPNAGLPAMNEKGETVYDLEPSGFGAGMGKIIGAGASIVGGCCGTDPSYIRAIPTDIDISRGGDNDNGDGDIDATGGSRMLSSERSHLIFKLDGRFIVIGERINPTGKKKLQAELKDGNFDMAVSFAEEQEERGADILDVNMGMSGVDEKALMLKAVDTVTQASSLPLCIDTSYPEVMEAALRRYPGRALINSISAESDRCDRMLGIAKKYGAMFILLPIGDSGLPKDQKEKRANIELVLQKAFAMGFSKEDIIVDGLVGTVGAIPTAALDTLETIEYCHSMGLATTCGLSNISFGLPERINVNTAFLAMAIRSHLTSAIMNPNQNAMIRMALASDLLMAHPDSDTRYIEHMNEHADEIAAEAQLASKARQNKSADGASSSNASDEKTGGKAQDGVSALKAGEAEAEEIITIRNAVVKGRKEAILEMTEDALSKGIKAKSILDEALIPAINEVGVLFDKGRYFLPQLIASARTMEQSIRILEPHLATGGSADDAPVIVMATVEGDIHDIGKNLVVLMLKNYGFRVIDLGKNVPKETIIETAVREKADIIGLSALMTTTMNEMRNVVNYGKEQGYRGKFMVGGAVVTEEYCKEIGADGYSADASEAVKVARKLIGS
ncbi:MAG: homocysteine S-methyltransferase family protein [Lachnospiraceae bacterium]|nr:homocysteine S-methyltransferase family protein [Lachnospiraceae bacterium]